MTNRLVKNIITIVMILTMTIVPVCAAGDSATTVVQPRYSNIGSVVLTLAFDESNVAHCCLSVDLCEHGSGISGLVKLFNSEGTCIKIWSVSDYEEPISNEFTYQCTYGETYTVTFEGYAYSNNQTPADRIEVSVSNTCIDR